MNRFLQFACAIVIAASSAPTVAAQSPAMVALETLGSSLRGAAAWHAPYRQEYVAAGMNSGETVTGEVTAAWPDHARFLTGDPITQQMGLDGRVVRLIDLEVGSCDQHVLDDNEWSRIPLAAVLDPNAAIEHFAVLEYQDNGFALVPHDPGGVRRVEVVLGADGLPEQVTIIDPQGATNRLAFGGWREADPPANGAWLPEPPAGVECVMDAR
jgi:hypothetical protein